MSNLPVLKHPVRDINGVPINGAKLYTYEAGSSTPKTAYADQALTTPLANPVASDAAGYFPEVYLTPGDAYKIKIVDDDLVTIYEVDDIYGAQLSSDSLITRVRQIASNPLDYGAVGDGVADESAAVQAAINAATGVVDLLGKTYRCDSALTLKSGVTVRGPGTLDFSSCGADQYIKAWGTLGDAVGGSGLSRGAVAFTAASVSGLAEGDWLLYYDTGSLWGVNYLGQATQIKSIAGLTVNVVEPFLQAYGGGGYNFKKISPMSNVGLVDVAIRCSESPSGTTPAVVSLRKARNVRLRNVKVDTFDRYGVEIDTCIGVDISGCSFENADANATAAGVYVYQASKDVYIHDSTFRRLSVGVYAGNLSGGAHTGVPMDVRIDRCAFHDCTQVLDTSDECGFVSLHRCEVWGGASANLVDFEGLNFSIKGNRFISPDLSGGAKCINAVPYTRAAPLVVPSGHAQNEVCDNFCEGGSIYVQGGRALNTRVNDNRIISAHNLQVAAGPDTQDAASYIEVDGNSLPLGDLIVTAVAGTAVNTLMLSVSRNRSKGTYIDGDGNVLNLRMLGNQMRGTGLGGAYAGSIVVVKGCLRNLLSDNLLEDISAGGQDGFIITGANGDTYTIKGNNVYVKGAYQTIDFDGYCDAVLVQGNILEKNEDTVDNVKVDGGGAAGIEAIACTGNIIINGAIGIAVTNTTADSINDGNAFVGLGGANTSGFTVSGDAA